MVAIRFLAYLAVSALIFIILTVLLHYLFKSKKYVKYTPSAAAFLFGLYNIITMFTAQRTGFEDIAKGIYAVFFLTGFLSGLLCGIVLDLVLPRMKKI